MRLVSTMIECFGLTLQCENIVLRLHPAHARRKGLVSQVEILGLVEVLKPCMELEICQCE